jgi:MFS family permease
VRRTTWTPVAFWLGLDAAALAVALPEVARDLPAGLSDLYWALGAFGAALALGALIGHQRLIGPALLLVGSVVCALSGSPGLLIAGRAVQGLGLGLALGRGRGPLPWIVALPAGALAGGLIADWLGWQWVFVFEALLALAAIAMARTATATATATADAPDRPRIELRLLRNPSFAGASLAAFVLGATVLATLLFVGLYLEGILGHGPAGAALRLLALAVPAAALAPVSTLLSESRGSRWALAPGLALAGIGLLLMRSVAAEEDWTRLLIGLVLTGAGAGLAAPALAWTAAGIVAATNPAGALRLKTAFLGAGITVGALALGKLFTDNLNSVVRGNFLQLFGGDRDNAADFIGTGEAARSANEGLQRFGELYFVGALQDVLLGAGLVAIFGALAVFILVRPEDFEAPA